MLITVCLLLSQENRTPPEGQNRLAFEKSPYLLQHAHNPVDWYPWGEAAFRKAARENKPIFLSIGYSTCHWCHVMETESFEDRAVADFLNAHFVSVKVDREERQDVDEVYMAAAMEYNNGRGGWPLTIFMGPDKKPFFAGTYFPRKILLDLLKQAAELWERQPERLKKSAEELTGALKAEESGKAKLSDGILRTAYDQLRRRFDPEHGGFGASPKFPSPHNFGFLLRYWDRSGEGEALRMVQKTLRSMRDGGIFDQVGLGFHRYSTDREWLVPHFEKMLYDQATLLMAYVEAYQATGEASFAETAREIAAYALGPLRSPEGAFYSAEDADSEGEEGKFYAWTSGEFRQVLGAEWERHAAAMDITEAGNLEKGRNILRRKEAPGAGWENARRKLFDAREKRIHPRKDDKILASWNGLMIAALAKAAAALDESSFAQGASEAAAFLHQKMRRADGRLLRRYRDGEAAIGGYVDDYASFIWGLLELYEATFEPKYLEQALALAAQMVDLFWDSKNGGFFYSGRDAEELIVRRKETYDGAAPSGNSVAALDLARLGRLIARSDLEARGAAALEALSGDLVRAPRAYTAALAAVDFLLGPTKEVVLCGRRDAPDTRALRQVVGKRFLPRAVVLFMPAEEGRAAVAKLAPYSSEHRPLQGKAAAYVCRNYACRLPTADPEAFSKLLEER